jgi:hypothetical protein
LRTRITTVQNELSLLAEHHIVPPRRIFAGNEPGGEMRQRSRSNPGSAKAAGKPGLGDSGNIAAMIRDSG